ncbi:adenine nucleotide alpha hydrolases-like protein [Rhizoclosmatium globosum]|uniref:Adenine nucleotide alpha hydrolases-like protein n=1 Tax=Rhizoclosmatium globosum TaxID=329046 RepID=A0A1Y2BKT2_9FUNG|nr:adenine nucleotide alpha hydrolases-like protein [Rhizoclosmatium globosum]|eukprot:ORY35230.1 adenine nucleotide alpha hydrolases-like protein [Rhizoclosmatium globosum]
MTADEIHNATEIQGAAPYKRTIAIALDSSKFSEYAFYWALEHYLRQDDYVLLLNVQHSSGNAVIDPPLGHSESTETTPKQESYTLLSHYAKILSEAKYAYKEVSIHPERVSVKESIVRAVHELHATALIVGSRGADAFTRGFLGSVSDYCAHHAHCPVLIAKPDEEEAKKWNQKSVDVSAYAQAFKLPYASLIV